MIAHTNVTEREVLDAARTLASMAQRPRDVVYPGPEGDWLLECDAILVSLWLLQKHEDETRLKMITDAEPDRTTCRDAAMIAAALVLTVLVLWWVM